MNFKKISRSLVCLLLVACMLVSISPIQANATGLVETVGAFLVSNPLALLGTVIAGLGVVAVADHYDVFENVARECETWMRANTDFFTSDGVYVAERTYGQHKYYAISESFIQAVRDFLFQTDVIVPIASGISFTELTWDRAMYMSDLLNECGYPLFAELEKCSANSALITAMSSSLLIGFYFHNGQLSFGAFENPYGISHASYCGVYDLTALTLVQSVNLNVSGCKIFKDKESAYASSDFLTSPCFVIDWNSMRNETLPFIEGYLKGFYKPATNVDFGDEIAETHFRYWFRTANGNFSNLTYYYLASGFDSTAVSMTVSSGLAAGSIAPADKTLSEGYADWATGVITLPGSTTIPNQDEEDKYYPIDFPPDISDVFDMTQEEAQGGTKTEMDSNVGTNSDPVTGTNLKSWIQSLKDSLAQWFSRLTLHVSNIFDAISSLPTLVLGFFRTLASHFKSIALLGVLFEMLIEWLHALFSWLPENMLNVVVLLFGVSFFYKIIGR